MMYLLHDGFQCQCLACGTCHCVPDASTHSGLPACTGTVPADASQCPAVVLPPSPPNTPPTLTLIMTPSLGQVVRMRQGSTYEFCNTTAGQVPTLRTPCEPGAAAVDGEEDDVTHRLLLCPPPPHAAGDSAAADWPAARAALRDGA